MFYMCFHLQVVNFESRVNVLLFAYCELIVTVIVHES